LLLQRVYYSDSSDYGDSSFAQWEGVITTLVGNFCCHWWWSFGFGWCIISMWKYWCSCRRWEFDGALITMEPDGSWEVYATVPLTFVATFITHVSGRTNQIFISPVNEIFVLDQFCIFVFYLYLLFQANQFIWVSMWNSGPGKGSFYHEIFLHDWPDICQTMVPHDDHNSSCGGKITYQWSSLPLPVKETLVLNVDTLVNPDIVLYPNCFAFMLFPNPIFHVMCAFIITLLSQVPWYNVYVWFHTFM
jgi:hypothetical protein